MPKAILEFQLPEEAPDHQLAIQGAAWMSTCHDLDNWLRGKIKHEDHESSELQDCRNKLHEFMRDNEVEFG